MAGSETANRGTRRLALIVHTWGHASSFFAWTFLKQYILRRLERDGCTELDPSEELFIVKAGKDDGDDRWKMGGPLVPDLDTAVAHYPCTIVRLEGGAKSSLAAWLERSAIDLLVIGEHWPQGGLKMTMSVSEWVKQNVSCPFLIIRRAAVANARMKISSSNSSSGVQATAAAQQPAASDATVQDPMLGRISPSCPRTVAMTGRRIAIAYTSFAVGRGLIQWTRDKLISAADTIYICHVFHKNPVVQQTMKLVRAMTLQRPEVLDEVTRDNSIEFGAAELAGYRVHLNVTLQGDPKSALTAFCESEQIDLLVIGTRSTSKIRKTMSGGSVSSFLIDHAPCPCLVVPYKLMGVDEGRDTLDDEAMGSSPGSPSWLAAAADEGGAAPRGPSPTIPAVTVAAEVATAAGSAHSTPSDLLAALQKQLEDKDRVIAELRQQVAQLQLAVAQREAARTHDAEPMRTNQLV